MINQARFWLCCANLGVKGLSPLNFEIYLVLTVIGLKKGAKRENLQFSWTICLKEGILLLAMRNVRLDYTLSLAVRQFG